MVVFFFYYTVTIMTSVMSELVSLPLSTLLTICDCVDVSFSVFWLLSPLISLFVFGFCGVVVCVCGYAVFDFISFYISLLFSI